MKMFLRKWAFWTGRCGGGCALWAKPPIKQNASFVAFGFPSWFSHIYTEQAKRRINESMSSRLLRRTRTARPDNDLAARTWRIHDRMGAPPFWRNNDNVEVRPEIHDHSVETRRDSAVHPTRGRRYVQVKETGWKEIVPPDMPFDVNRLHEPLVSMSRFWPNVQPDQPPLKFALNGFRRFSST